MMIKPRRPKAKEANPLIAKLNFIRSRVKFDSKIEERQDKRFDLSEESLTELKSILESEFFAPNDTTWRIYSKMCEMLEIGYRYKNIQFPEYYAEMNKEMFEGASKDGGVDSSRDVELGGSIIGPSGIGKTTTIARVLELFPKSVLHPAINTAYQRPFLQIPFLISEVNGRSAKSVMIGLLADLGEKTGIDEYKNYTDRQSENTLLKALKAGCWQFGVGLIILDESQTFITESGKQQGSDSPNAKFLQRIYIDLKLPILLLGTPELDDFLSCNSHTFRRYKKNVNIKLRNHPENSEYWNTLVVDIIQNFVFFSEVEVTDKHLKTIYTYTVGNFSILKMFINEMIELVRSKNVKQITDSLIDEVYESIRSTVNGLTRMHLKPADEKVKTKQPPRKPRNSQSKTASANLKPESNSKANNDIAKRAALDGKSAHDLFRKK